MFRVRMLKNLILCKHSYFIVPTTFFRNYFFVAGFLVPVRRKTIPENICGNYRIRTSSIPTDKSGYSEPAELSSTNF